MVKNSEIGAGGRIRLSPTGEGSQGLRYNMLNKNTNVRVLIAVERLMLIIYD